MDSRDSIKPFCEYIRWLFGEKIILKDPFDENVPSGGSLYYIVGY